MTMFDATINLGTVIQIISYVAAFMYFIWTIKTRLEVMDAKQATISEDMKDMKMELGRLTQVTIEQARHSARLDYLEAMLAEHIRKTQ